MDFIKDYLNDVEGDYWGETFQIFENKEKKTEEEIKRIVEEFFDVTLEMELFFEYLEENDIDFNMKEIEKDRNGFKEKFLEEMYQNDTFKHFLNNNSCSD